MANRKQNRGQRPQNNQLIASKTTTEATYTGPLPLPEHLEKYESINPGTAERIIAMAERQAAHRQELEAVVVKITARAGGTSEGTGGKLFGAVTTKEISEELLAQHGIEIEKNKIVQEEAIKSFGSYEIKCKLGFEITGVINVLVTEGK